jgi:signal peptidase II
MAGAGLLRSRKHLIWLGTGAAVSSFVVDQLHKWWMIYVYQIEERVRVQITPFLDLVMAWNKGISYGLLSQDSTAGLMALVAFSLVVIVVLAFWMVRQESRIISVAIGLIIGGALGNVVDRMVHGAVADFFLLHWSGFNWYVFNIADMAIVAGALILVYDALFSNQMSK